MSKKQHAYPLWKVGYTPSMMSLDDEMNVDGAQDEIIDEIHESELFACRNEPRFSWTDDPVLTCANDPQWITRQSNVIPVQNTYEQYLLTIDAFVSPTAPSQRFIFKTVHST